MKHLLGTRHVGMYTKIFLYVTLSIFTTIVVLSSILYINNEKIALRLIHASVRDNLTHISYSANVMIDLVKTQSVQIYLDNDIAGLYYANRLDAEERRKALERLHMYRNTLPNIHSIYVYNGHTRTFYTDFSSLPEYSEQSVSDFFDRDAVEMIENYPQYPIFKPIARQIPEPIPGYKDKQYSNVYSFLFYENRNPGDTRNALILNISEAWMRQIINSLDIKSDSDIFILNAEGRMINTSNKEYFLTDLGSQPYIRRILDERLADDSYVADVDGEKSLVTYVSSDTTGWKFVQVTPYRAIVDQIKKLKDTTITIGLAILLLGLLVAAVASRGISSPFDSIMNKISNLERRERSDKESLKRELLKNLVLFGTEDTVELLQEKLAGLQPSLKPKEPFVLALLVIDGYRLFSGTTRSHDRQLYKYSILNIAVEIISPYFPTECVDLGDKHMALLLNVPRDSDEWQATLHEALLDVQRNVEKYQKLSVSASVSSVGDSAVDAHYYYKEALDNSRYLLFVPPKHILYAHDIAAQETKEYVYPADKEKHLVNELMLGKGDDAKRTCRDMIEGTSAYPIHAYNTAILRVVLALGAAIEHLEREQDMSLGFDTNQFVAEVNLCESIEQVHDRFDAVIEAVVDKLGEQKTDKYEELIGRIVAIVERDYMDPNLSIYSISSDVKMSPVYLGRLFKKINNHSISSYISDYRMEKAKQLLQTTSQPVSNVAESVGFANANYFFTLFKKLNGVTPNEYRQLSGNVPSDESRNG